MAEQLVTPHPLRIQSHGLTAMAAHIESVRGQPHVYGSCDCWTFVRDGVRALSADDTFGADVPDYTDAAGAAAAFDAVLSGCTLRAYFEAWHLRERHNSITAAQPGDLLVWTPPGEPVPHFGLVIGRWVWECTAEAGVSCTPLKDCVRAASALDEHLTLYRVAVA